MAFTARLPAGLDRELTEAAKARAIPKQVLLEQILREWLKGRDERDRISGRDRGIMQPLP
jgi:predicted transcriptional regulator